MNQRKIYVYAAWENNKKVGTIFCDTVNGTEVISFEYDSMWLSDHPHLTLDPTIPVTSYRVYSRDRALFGVFQDSCPDRWGRQLMDRRESRYAAMEDRHPRKFTDSDYMLGVQDECRSGGLRFKTQDNGDFLNNDTLPIPPITSIRELEQISLAYEDGIDDRWISQLVNPGSSLGGARPKASVLDTDGSLWIAKFPSRNDDYDVGAWEKVVHDMAEMCGIMVSSSKLSRYSNIGSTFLTKRFDRVYNGKDPERIHFASAMTMLGLRDGHTDGTGFLDLAEIVEHITCDTRKELHELFRRVIFDIAVSNQDDHLRNHGFLLENGSWTLSPAYDINPVHNADYLAMNIDMDDGYRSFEKALATCEFYHMDKDSARAVIDKTKKTVSSSWKRLASGYGIKESEQKMMAPAFGLCL